MDILRYLKRKKKQHVMNYLKRKGKSSPLHFTLIDPEKDPKKLKKTAETVCSYGTDAILVGGSQSGHLIYLNDVIQTLKESVDLPVILFPCSHSGLSPYADAVLFMSLLNSRSVQYLIDEQMKGSVLVKNYKLEPLPTGYLIVESGSTTSVTWTGDVKPLPRQKPEFAVAYALAAKYFGMKFLYLEAGSGAKLPVPDAMISAVKNAVNNGMMVIVGGGVRDEKTAKEKIKAGADIIVTGNIIDDNLSKVKSIIKAVHRKK